VTAPTRARADRGGSGAVRGLADVARRRLEPALSPGTLALALIVVGGLALRLYGIDHGLPFVYNYDELYHFTSRAIAMLGGNLNPEYFDNPTTLTYLIHFALRFQYGGFWPFGDLSGVMDDLKADPSGAYLTARSISTVLCMAAVVALYSVGKRLWGTAEGVAAAAILSFAFLPVAYSRLALTDVGVLLPVTVAVYGAVKIREDGRRGYFLLTGVAIGLAVGFKYTAGVLVAPFLVAAALRARRDHTAFVYAVLGLLTAALVFTVTNPFFLLNLPDALAELRGQSGDANTPKAGQPPENRFGFYLGSLTWGLGLAAALAAAGGLVWELRRDPVRALLLALLPLLLVVYLAGAERFFARWLLPVYPVLAMFAGVALARLARLPSRRAGVRAGVLALLLAVVLAQPLAADVRSARVLAREDTRQITRSFLLDRLPPGGRLVIEPSVPPSYYRGRFSRGFRLRTAGKYITVLEPGLIDRYRRAGHCLVVTMSTIRGRAEATGEPKALAYYRRLERESQPVFGVLPYRPGAEPVPFDFNRSLLYYSPAFSRPGPEVDVYRLDRCSQQAPAQSARGPAV
jgi:hypothetical protein